MPPVGFEPKISADERPEESYRLCCVVVCALETSRMGAPYIYDISHLRVKFTGNCGLFILYSPVTNTFNIQHFYIQSTRCIYVFCEYLRTNSDYLSIH